MKYFLFAILIFDISTAFAQNSKCLGPSIKSKQKMVQSYQYQCNDKMVSQETIVLKNGAQLSLSSWIGVHDYLTLKLEHKSAFKEYSSAQEYVTYVDKLLKKIKPHKNSPQTINKIQNILQNIPDKRDLSQKPQTLPLLIDYQSEDQTSDFNIVFDKETISISMSTH